MKINPKSVIAAAVVFTLMTPMMASAVVKTNQVSEDRIVLSYSASELDTAVGRRYLEAKIERAAKKICGSGSFAEVRSIRQVNSNKSCYTEAVNNAMESLEGRTTTAD